MPQRPSILFACVGNAARSQMAHAIAHHLARDRVELSSGGSAPLGHVPQDTVDALAEIGIDWSHATSTPIDEEFARRATKVVTMGCGDDACPAFIGREVLDWPISDPFTRGMESFRAARDEIHRRVERLLRDLGVDVRAKA